MVRADYFWNIQNDLVWLKRMIYILSTLSLAYLVILSISQIEANASEFLIRKSIFIFAVFSVSYAVGKIYCIEWGKLVIIEKKFDIMLFLYEKIIFPAALLFFIIGATVLPYSTPKQNLHIYGIILFFLLGDWLGVVRSTIKRWYPGISPLEQKKLFLQFPPKSRLDMLPMDFYFNFMILFFIYKRIF